MSNYLSKSHQVEAVQITWRNVEDSWCWVVFDQKFTRASIKTKNGLEWFFRIKTRQGTLKAEVGDYLVKMGGEIYPVKGDIFKKMYKLKE